MVKAWAEDAQRGGVFIFAVEDRTLEELLTVLDGGSSDVVGDVCGVSRPE